MAFRWMIWTTSCSALACGPAEISETAPSEAKPDAANSAGGVSGADGSAGSASTTPRDDGGAACGNGSCESGETCATCESDCCVPMFVAQGMMGRTTVSCDDGKTWVGNRSWELEGDHMVCGSTEPAVCFEKGAECVYVNQDGQCSTKPCDCGHHPGFGKGVAFGNGTFVATWGWGHPGSVRRSRNGLDWEPTLEGVHGFGGLAFGAGHFVLANRTPRTSTDGALWKEGGLADFRSATNQLIWSVRRFGFGDHDGGRFVAIASGGGHDMLVSSDAGDSWWRPESLPAGCGHDVSTFGDILYGGGTFVVVGGNGNACRSTDGGTTWALAPIAGEGAEISITSQGVWTGSEFWIWSDSARYASADGETWTATPMKSPKRIGPVARSPSGTLVAAANVWNGYAKQRFLRSTDGIDWQTLASDAFVASHPIFHLAFGRAEPSEVCPAHSSAQEGE